MMRKIILLLFILSMVSTSLIAQGKNDLVIVTSNESHLSQLNAKELKRIFLGLKVKNNGSHITPIRNHSDEILHEVFLQKIMFMSSRTYERQLNLRAVKKGLKRPAFFSNRREIINALIKNSDSISYMWKKDAKRLSQIKIIKTR